MSERCPTCDGRGTMPEPYGDGRDNGRTFYFCPDCHPEKYQPPTLFGLATRIYDAVMDSVRTPHSMKGGSVVAIATIMQMLEEDRERTFQPFRDLIEWDSEENDHPDFQARWLKLGNKLWDLVPPKKVPPKEAPDA